MSILQAMGITIQDQASDKSDQIGFDHKGICNLHAATLQRAIHDLERFKQSPNSKENQKWAIDAQRWFLDDTGWITFIECCNVLGFDIDAVVNKLTKLSLFLSDLELVCPVRPYRRKHQLSLALPLERKDESR